MSDIKVVHLRNQCIGCNACICNAPQSWEMDEKDGKSRLINSVQKGNFHVASIEAQDLDANLKAAEACPMRIIQVNQRNQ